MKSNRFIAYIAGAIIGLFIIYNLILAQSQTTHAIVFINDNRSIPAAQPRNPHIYSFVTNKILVPTFVKKIIDKAQGPATCLIIIRTADGAIGNRMFLFASAYGLARLHQCDLYVCSMDYYRSSIDISSSFK